MIAGLILAGGRGRRMGGRNKALLEVSGTALLASTIRRFSPQVERLAISANDPLPPDIVRDILVLRDADESRPGPLGGILAGLEWARGIDASHLASVAVDTPGFPRDLVARLGGGDPVAIAVAASGGRRHPTFALWPVHLSEQLRDFVYGEGGRRVVEFIERHPHREVVFDDYPDPFFNINTPDDLAQAEADHG